MSDEIYKIVMSVIGMEITIDLAKSIAGNIVYDGIKSGISVIKSNSNKLNESEMIDFITMDLKEKSNYYIFNCLLNVDEKFALSTFKNKLNNEFKKAVIKDESEEFNYIFKVDGNNIIYSYYVTKGIIKNVNLELRTFYKELFEINEMIKSKCSKKIQKKYSFLNNLVKEFENNKYYKNPKKLSIPSSLGIKDLKYENTKLFYDKNTFNCISKEELNSLINDTDITLKWNRTLLVDYANTYLFKINKQEFNCMKKNINNLGSYFEEFIKTIERAEGK